MHDPQALVGQSLSGKYQVRRLIGRGGMGSVYEGQNIEIGKRVAIKTIDQGHAMSGELATRLRREARASAAVESNHIVQVFDVGEDPKCGVYMVMEFLLGEDLGAKLQREGKLDPQTTVTIAIQVGRALVKAHGAGIVHRDLKPGNVFLTEKEEGGLLVKVVDFGISKLLRDDVVGESKNLTRMGTALGTPQYMSPEQAQGNANVDHRTDVWALGCLLFEMLAGRAPFEEAGSYEMTIVRILTTRPPPLLSVAPWVPLQLARVVDAALIHEWDQRVPDAQTMVRQLGEAMQLDISGSTGRYSAVSVPQYQTGQMAIVQRPATPVALDATMPMNGEHEALIAQARAAAGSGSYGQQPQHQHSQPQHQPSHPSQPQTVSGGYGHAESQQAGSGGHPAQQVSGYGPSPRKPISTETAVVVAPSASHSAVSVDEAAAGVPSRGGSAILFLGLGALVVALGVGGYVMFARDAKPAPAAKPAQTATSADSAPKEKEKEKEKTEPSAKLEPSVKPEAPASATGSVKGPLGPREPIGLKGKLPGTSASGALGVGGPGGASGKGAPSAVATASAGPSATGPKGGTGFGGAGVSESY